MGLNTGTENIPPSFNVVSFSAYHNRSDRFSWRYHENRLAGAEPDFRLGANRFAGFLFRGGAFIAVFSFSIFRWRANSVSLNVLAFI